MLVLCAASSNAKTEILFIPWKLDSTKRCKFCFFANNSGFDWYLFQLIFLVKPDFNCCNNFALSWNDKVTTETQSFVSVIAYVVSWFVASV